MLQPELQSEKLRLDTKTFVGSSVASRWDV